MLLNVNGHLILDDISLNASDSLSYTMHIIIIKHLLYIYY